jgi:hypothetical protein
MNDARLWHNRVDRRFALMHVSNITALMVAPTGISASAAATEPRQLNIADAAIQLKGDGWRLPGGLQSTEWLTGSAARSIDMLAIDLARRTAGFALFLSGCQIFLANRTSENPVVGFYNPVLDVWWLTLWQNTNQVIGAKFLPAPLFPDGTSPFLWRPPIENLSPRRTLIESLRTVLSRAKGNFRTEFAIDGKGGQTIFDRIAMPNAAPTEIANRISRIATEVSLFNADGAARAAYAGVTSALAMRAAVSPAGISSQASEAFAQIAALPFAERAVLVPVGAWKVDQTWFVVSAAVASMGSLVLTAIATNMSSPIHRLALISAFGTQP